MKLNAVVPVFISLPPPPSAQEGAPPPAWAIVAAFLLVGVCAYFLVTQVVVPMIMDYRAHSKPSSDPARKFDPQNSTEAVHTALRWAIAAQVLNCVLWMAVFIKKVIS